MLIEQIKKDQITARKERNAVASTLLTTLLGEANMVAKNQQRDVPTNDEVQAVIKKFLKGNTETQTVLRKSGEASNGALGIAMAEQKILEAYMPKQLSEAEIGSILEDAIAQGTPLNVGALMGFLKTYFAGQYDGKVASAVIKAHLN